MTSNGGQGQPPATRSRAASVRAADTEELKDSIVEAVVARLMQSGLVVPTAMTPAAAAAGVAAASGAATEAVPDAVAVKVEYDEEEEVGVPPPSRRRLWLEELRAQLNASPHLGVREREEARSLLIIGDTAGPPPEHRSWYWGRVRLFLIVAHHGWAAAVRDSRGSEMERLGIRLSPAAALPPPLARPVAPPASGGRGRPSRPSGLRAPSGGAASAAAPRRKN
ncbi:hypothetical protein FJT64_001494 [Amphibalanus amphitrite]|uniref:Uncharacterized protein n=1 Tax=Amphibalanus amphitrite TaxID=1232801 RepID=A0A6A4V0N7_AMPAM|nr:hypothetical protein FJT64_001494 [Amphibalanus amphitrite]